jgi:hypothetical protein
MGKTIKEYDITWEGLVFTVCGIYEPEEKESYFEPYERERFNISGIYLGDACVDFMLNESTTNQLEEEILETYYR